MFLGTDIIEFINKIINSEEIKGEEIANNLKEFDNYLKLTKMADEKTLACIEQVINCLPEIINLKNKIGYLDINILLKEQDKEEIKKSDKRNVKQKTKKYEEKHYIHYQDSSADPCGCSSGTSSRRC